MARGNGPTTKPCPKCGEGKIMTGRTSAFNPKIDGKQVCEDCFVRHLYQQYALTKD